MPLARPAATVITAVVLVVFAALGIGRIRVDDSLSQLFRSDTPAFHKFEHVSHDFPSSEYDVLIVVTGEALLAPESVEKLRSLVTDVQLVEGVRGVLSMFSAREAVNGGNLPVPLFPDPLPQGPDYKKLLDRVMSNQLVRDRLLAGNGQLALVILSLEPSLVESDRLQTALDEIRRIAASSLEGSHLTAEFSGVPAMQVAIRHALERDRVLFNAVGFALGCCIAALFFRRLSLMVIAAAPPLLAIVFALGALGWMGFRLNMFLNVMTPLIMIISFSDSMQLTFAARDQIMAGRDKRTAFKNAIFVVGPACVLTHAAAGLSLLGLSTSSSDLIRGFGEAGFLATIIALITVLSLVPVFGVLLIRDEARLVATLNAADPGVGALRRFCAWIAVRMVSHPARFSLAGIVALFVFASIYAGLKPSYRLADQVPDQEQAVAASGRLDAALTGSNPLYVLVTLPSGAELFSPAALSTIADVHDVMANQQGIGNVWSLETLREWLKQQVSSTDVGTLRQYVGQLPEFLVRRFVDSKQSAVIVFGLVPDKNLSKLLPIIDQLDGKLDAVRAAHPGYQIEVTGLSAIAARNSAEMINKLNRALTVEFAFIAAFIGLAFRSARIGLACLAPGIFPVVAAGSLLRLFGYGLQFSAVVALTVSFGLGLSATIHFLNRMTRERKPWQDPAIAVKQATVLVGPALILTTLVLVCGLAALVLSDLPALRLFGWLSALAMFAALVADLLILRPVVTFLLRLGSPRASQEVSATP